MEDKKIQLVVRQFERLHISLAGLQETRWFGSVVYHVCGSTVLTSGRPVPTSSPEPNYRGEGVAIVLSGVALQAWKAGGCQWKGVSPRLITAKLLFGTQWLHVVSCYAPTYAQPRHVKNEFFDTLCSTLLSIPEKDLCRRRRLQRPRGKRQRN